MDPLTEPARPNRRYKWPRYLLGALLLGAVLAILWMSVAVRRARAWRDPNSPPPANGSNPK